MRTRLIPTILLAAAGFTCANMPAAADDAVATGRVPTVTRLVKIFSTLENEWNADVQRRDSAALDKLLAADFEMRTAAAPGRPIPRADWLGQSMSDPVFTSHTEQMAAHEYGNTVVVSFLWNIDAPADGSSSMATRLFVVDTWIQESGAWHASTRYIAPIIAPVAGDLRVPGLPLNMTEIPKKY